MIALHATAWFLLGLVVGALNASLLVRTVWLVRPDLRLGSAGVVIGGFLLRYAVTAGLLIFAVRQGLGPLLAAGLGLWLARWRVVLLGRRAS